jgi:hypothetical protein
MMGGPPATRRVTLAGVDPVLFVAVTVYKVAGDGVVGVPEITHVVPSIESPAVSAGDIAQFVIAAP